MHLRAGISDNFCFIPAGARKSTRGVSGVYMRSSFCPFSCSIIFFVPEGCTNHAAEVCSKEGVVRRQESSFIVFGCGDRNAEASVYKTLHCHPCFHVPSTKPVDVAPPCCDDDRQSSTPFCSFATVNARTRTASFAASRAKRQFVMRVRQAACARGDTALDQNLLWKVCRPRP